MQIKKYIPADILKPFIKTFMIIESENVMENRILPDTSIVMAFRYAGNTMSIEKGTETNPPRSAISGLRKSVRFLRYQQNSGTVLVIFKETGAAAFFNEPLHELFGMSVSLDYLIPPPKLNEIEEKLAGAKDDLQRISVIERFLFSRLRKSPSDPLVVTAMQKIKLVNGDIRIKDLATELHISQDPFEKRFRQVMGATPKQLSGIVRFRNLIDKYSEAERLTDVAYTAGYFDQPHFNKAFKLFTGQTPTDFFKSPSFW